MNIKDAEKLSGVPRQNIRFYEREGLITPSRNPENDYRKYTDAEILRLKQVRVLRMLDMPLDRVRDVLSGKLSLSQAAQAQRLQLAAEKQRLEQAIHCCDTLSDKELQTLDIDRLLDSMNAAQGSHGFFAGWVEDYRKLCRFYRDKVFSFTPEDAVTNPAEFTMALCHYAYENNLDLVITKESMYPEFTIGGIEYSAERHYTGVGGFPVAVIRCTAKYPEDFAPSVSEKRKPLLMLWRYGCILALFLLLNLPILLRGDWDFYFSTWEGILVFLSMISIMIVGAVRYLFLHANDRT